MFAFLALSATLLGAAYASPIALQPRAFTPPSGLSEFALKTGSATTNASYMGWYPKLFQVSPGQGVAVLTADKSETITWEFNEETGDVYYVVPNMGKWSLGFSDDEPQNDAPDGYKVVTINGGYASSGFSFTGNGRNILPNPSGRGTMAACPVDGTTPESGPQVQLLWRDNSVAASTLCVDLVLQAESA